MPELDEAAPARRSRKSRDFEGCGLSHQFAPSPRGYTRRPRDWRIECHILWLVAGMSMCLMPNGASASRMALTTAGGAPIAPASPHPFAPIGLVVHGIST